MTAYLLLLVLGLSSLCHASNPGIKLRMTEKDMNAGVQYVFNKMTDKVKNQTLPAVNGSASFGEDALKYQLSQIQITRFDYASLVSTFVPTVGVDVTLQGGNGEINCNWNLESFFLHDSGTAVLTLKGISISMVVGLHQSSPGVPSIFMHNCKSFVEGIDIKMESTISYIYDILKEPIAEMVRHAISQQLCPALVFQVYKWDTTLRDLELKFTLAHMIDADWSLLSKPEISDEHVDLSFKGQFNLKGQISDVFSPNEMAFPAQQDSRPQVGVSEASLNSLLNAYHTSGSLNLVLTEVLASKELTATELETVIPKVSQQYKSLSSLNITLNVTSSPVMHLKDNNITLDLTGLLQISATPPNQIIFCSKILASLTVNVFMSDSSNIPGLNLNGSFSLNSLQIDKSEPSVKAPKGVSLEQASQQIFSQWVLPLFNEELKKGMTIPTHFIRNPSVSSKQSFALLEVSMNWEIFNF